jgi:hypothetical protein
MIKIAAQTLTSGRAVYFFLADLQRLRPLTNGNNMTEELEAWPLCELTGADLQRHRNILILPIGCVQCKMPEHFCPLPTVCLHERFVSSRLARLASTKSHTS